MNLTGLSVLCTSFLAGFYFGPGGISGLREGFLWKFCTLLAMHVSFMTHPHAPPTPHYPLTHLGVTSCKVGWGSVCFPLRLHFS